MARSSLCQGPLITMTPYKVAFITGAGAGIGKALALELASKGWAIAAVDVREAGLVALAAELHAQNRAVPGGLPTLPWPPRSRTRRWN